MENSKEVKVESVKAINGNQVQVTFSTPVAANDVAGKVSVEGVTLTSPVLSADGKTLTINAVMAGTSNPINVKNAAVVVNPIKTKADANVTTEKFVSLLTFKDTVAPTIKNVEAKTNGTVAKTATVNLSEPIQAGALVKVNGAYATASYSAPSDTINLSGLNLETGKTHTVEVINATDAAGNKVVSQSATFTVAVDSVVPVATVTAGGSDKEILVTFDKSMNVSSVQTALANGIVKSESLGAITSGATRVVPNTDDKQFIIDVTEASIFADKDSRTFSVVLPKNMEDKLGNKTAESIQKVTLTKDTVKPVATGYNVVKEADGKIKAIEVIFSEGLKASGASDSIQAGQTLHQAASTIVNENGVAETTKFANYVSKAVAKGDKKVVFEASSAEAITGKYAFSFNNELVKDLSEAGNKSSAFNYTIDFGQAKADTEFELTSAKVTNDGSVNATTPSSNKIQVVFGTAVKGGAVAGSATDVTNYTLGGKPLPEGTTILLNSLQTEATITLPVGSIAQDDQAVVFTAANVKTTDGTKTLKPYTGTVKLADTVAPVLDSAKVLDNKTIELTYSEAIQIDAAGTTKNLGDSFVIKQGDTVLSLANAELTGTIASGFDKKLVLTIAKGSDTPGTPASAVKGGANQSIATLSNETSATTTGAGTFVIQSNGEVQNTADSNTVVGTLTGGTGAWAGSFVFNGVTVTIAGGSDNNTFTVNTTAAVAPTSATTLDLTKDITIETKAATPKKVVDKSASKNEQKAAVKVNVVKP